MLRSKTFIMYPARRQKLLARQNLARARKNAVRRLNSPAVSFTLLIFAAGQPAKLDAEDPFAKAVDFPVLLAIENGTLTQRRANAGQQLAGSERLGDGLCSPEFQADDLYRPSSRRSPLMMMIGESDELASFRTMSKPSS